MYSTGISRWFKIKDVKKLKQDTEDDPIIKDQMANMSCLLVCTFGNFLAPILIATHTANNLDFGDETGYGRLAAQHEEKDGYESDHKI